MKNEKLFDGITGIRDDIVEKAENYQFQKMEKDQLAERKNEQLRENQNKQTKKSTPARKSWVKWGAMAACACLVVGITVQYRNHGDGAGSGAGGGESGTVFMSYAGPIFPLHSLTEAEKITAERNVDYDLSPYETRQYSEGPTGQEYVYEHYKTESIVTDSYVLKNATDKDVTLSMVYPFVGSFREGFKYIPSISVAGNQTNTELYAGKFAGFFYSAHGFDTDKTDRSNIHGQRQWEGYQELLQDGQYLQDALAAYPELNQEVIVYKLDNIAYDGSDENATNPTLCFEYTVDENDTVLFSYGSTGGSRNTETGEFKQNYSIRRAGEREEGDGFLIVLGNDIKNPIVQGYRDGGSDEGEEITGVTADVERYETTLGEVIWDVLIENNNRKIFDEEEGQWEIASDEMVFGSIAELMYDYGMLSDAPAERYDWGRLEEMWSETYSMSRVLYLNFEVTVPANGSVAVEASMLKDASFDYAGHGTDRNGYDMVTTLGSTLEFTGQTASVSNTESIEIVYQNFGFDLENGITKVTLDVNEPHYYMEIRKLHEDGKKVSPDE